MATAAENQSPLERMKATASKYQKSSDLMQDAANQANTAVEVKELPGKKRPQPQTFQSRSKQQAQAVKNYNTNHHQTINKNYAAANDTQVERQDKQIKLAAQQAHTLRDVSNTMNEILTELKKQNKIQPKYQQYASNKAFKDQHGDDKKPGEDGMISKLGGLLGDLLDMGGGGEGKRKGRRGNRGGRGAGAGAGGGGGGGAARGGLGGMWDRAKGAMRSASHGGGGRAGTIAKVAAGVAGAVGVYEASDWVGKKLGSVSASEESGRGGVGTVSTGKGDNGGVSYGTHQLSSKSGTMARFLQSADGQKYANEFQGMTPGSAAFNQKYKEVAGKDGAGFAEAQENYIKRTHYAPMLNNISKDTGTDFSKRGKAVQEMLYSTGVQYGPGSSVVRNALKGKNVAGMSDKELVDTVQDYKSATVGTYFKKSSAATQASIAQRAQREKGKLHAVRQGEGADKATGVSPEANATNIATSGKSMAEVAASPSLAAATGKPVSQGGTVSGAALMSVSPKQTGMISTTEENIPANSDPDGEAEDQSEAQAPTVTSAQPQVPSMLAPMKPQDGSESGVGATALIPGAALVGAGAIDAAQIGKGAIDSGKGAVSAVRAGEQGLVRAGVGATARATGKALIPGANIAIGAYDAYDVITDDEKTRAEKERALSGVGGGMAGAAAGASAGGAAGTAIGAGIGSLFFGVGAAPGAVIGGGLGLVGGAVGGYFGYNYGQEGGEAAYDALAGTPEEQAAKDAAKENRPVAGSTNLLMMANNKAASGDTNAAAAAKQLTMVDQLVKSQTSLIAATTKEDVKKATEKTVDQATAEAKKEEPKTETKAEDKPADGKPVELPANDTPQTVDLTAQQSAGPIASATPQTQADANTLTAAATPTGSGTAATAGANALAAGLGVPAAWGAELSGSLAGAMAMQQAAANGTAPPVSAPVMNAAPHLASTRHLGGPNSPGAAVTKPAYALAHEAQKAVDAAMSIPTGLASGVASAANDVAGKLANPFATLGSPGFNPGLSLPGNPFANLEKPNFGAMAASATNPFKAFESMQNPSSPTSSSFYSANDVSPSASVVASQQAAPSASLTSSVASTSTASPTVSSAASYAEPVERQQYEPVKTVMALEPKQQDTMMPQRFKPDGDRIPSKGISEGNSSRQTLDDCPAVISDNGLVMLQTGFI